MTRLTLLGLVAVFAATSCTGGSDEPESRPTGQEDRLRTASAGLCRTLDLVEEGNLKQARVVFQDQSHDYLHEIAAKGLDAVPQETARLLQSKQVIERGLAGSGDPPPDLLQGVFDAQAALADLAVQLGLPRVEPCRGTAA